jgi:hypothetical protein
MSRGRSSPYVAHGKTRWRYKKVKEFDERFDAGQDMAAALVMGTLREPYGIGGEPYDEFDVKSY